MARIRYVSARICTWELVTGFGQDLTEENLVDYFRRDFPGVKSLPKFWKMISFNSSEGRHHRYLVISAESEDLLDCRGLFVKRALPGSLFLFARADNQMNSWDKYDNFRYAAIVDGTLYVLVFYEGRLCYWSEEKGYVGIRGMELATGRLSRIDEFLRRDPLFSGGESFRYGTLETLNMNLDESTGDWYTLFRKAAADPFWKGLHLETRRLGWRSVLSRILLLLLMVSGLFIWMTYDDWCGMLPGPAAPRLTLPVTEPVSKEPRFGEIVEKQFPKGMVETRDCLSPALEIRGIVGDRLFSGVFGGEPVVKKTGDSLDRYRVKSVLRDRVVLECNGREWEVVNGYAP